MIDLYVLLAGGALPNSTFLTELEAYLESFRPLSDNLTAKAPTVTDYTIALTYYIDPSNAGQAATIQAAVAAAAGTFTAWTQSKIGRGIIPDQLTAGIIEAGAKRVVMTSPSYNVIASTSIAVPTAVIVTYGGLDSA